MKQRLFYAIGVALALLCSQTGLRAQTAWQQVAANDCGTADAQPYLIKGDNYKLPDTFAGTKEALTCNFGGTVIYAFNQLDIQADYLMEVVYLADHERQQRIVADGNELQAPLTLTAGKEQRVRMQLPKKAYAYGQLVLVFEALKGSNAIVSELNLFSSNPRPLAPFEGEQKAALAHTQTYKVDTAISVASVMPLYTVKPNSVPGIYKPVQSLNGTWLFNARPGSNFPASPASPAEDTAWKPIEVPGQWSMQGFQVDSAGFGAYETCFTLPVDWKGDKRIKLRFDGVSSECIVYLNGKESGRHLGGMTAFELDITPLLHDGENRLSLLVRSESMADMLGSLTQYAAHQLGGITRKVTLFAVPDLYLSDLRIVTDLDDQYEHANLRVFASITNASAHSQADTRLVLSVDGLPLSLEQSVPALAPGETWSGWLEGKVSSPDKWDNEHPSLYTLRAELSNQTRITEQAEKRFGFREVEVAGNQLLVNGQAVKLRGVCRHESHPLTGRVISTDLARQDAELYRTANCNFVRTSHYPPAEEFLDICDELGMFVEVEAPVCWIGHHANENWKTLNYRDTTWYPYVLQANMETIHFYRNHPSVLFWSMANESYWNSSFAQIQEYVRQADPTRPHTFHDQAYGGFNNQGSTAPISNIHYPGPDGYKVAEKSERPMIYGEYCHLNVYNRSELVTDPGIRSDWALALAPAWENMYQTKGVLGGSIWSGIDDIFQLPDGNAVGYGPWGPIDGWRRPKPEYWDMKKIYSPIRVLTQQLAPSRSLSVEVENRYTYMDMNELRIQWRYGNEKGQASLALQPGQTGRMTIPIASPESANELYVSFTDPRGFVADEYVIPVGRQSQNELPEWTPKRTRLKTTKEAYIITGDDFSCRISRTTGQILSLQRGGSEQLCGGPWLMALPLTGGGCYPNHNANTPLFNDLCTDWTVAQTKASQQEQGVTVTVTGQYKEFKGQYALTVHANGELTASYAFDALEDVNPRQWGLVFEAPASYDKTFWRREGVWSVYPDDHISRPSGEASLFYPGSSVQTDPRTAPYSTWSHDANELGSNDFRSTRRNIWFAGLSSATNSRITVRSNGQQHWRSWLAKDRIRFLVADFVTAGNEMFLDSYYAPYRKPIKTGDSISGTILLRVE